MRRTAYIALLCILCTGTGLAQKASKGDQAFFEYNYQEAIARYNEEQGKAPLTPQQKLNLAKSYFSIRQYKQAADAYVNIYREDSIMDNHHFNTMLQALSKSSGKERVQAFLSTRGALLSDELMENATFNSELLESSLTGGVEYRVFALSDNSPQADFSPAFYGDDRLLFSSSRPQKDKDTYSPTGEAFMDIYVTALTPDGQVRNSQPLNSLPPLRYHEATPFYAESLDGILYVLSNAEDGAMVFDENGKNSLTIGLSKRNGAFQLLLRDPSTSFYYPFYQPETERLYFAADFEQGYGGTDLYYVITNQGQIMSAPVNLGPRINTPGNEISPFLFDGSLYFASDIFYGLGGMDLYKSDLQEDGTFSIPANLGDEINSTQDDFGFIIRQADSGYEGYFTSNRPGGKGNDDNYGFTVSGKPGLKTLVVSGDVVNTEAYGVAGARIRLIGASDNLIREAYSGADGAFRIEVPWRDNVRLTIDRDRYTSAAYGGVGQDTLRIGQPLHVVLKPVEAVVRQVRGRTELNAGKFYFGRGSSRMTDDIRLMLAEPLQALKEFPALHVRIEAHTDSRGSTAVNADLSTKRAEAIRDYLLENGIAAERIEAAEGFGESQLVNHCEDGVYCLDVLHQQNERYPIVVVNYDSL